MNRRHRIEVDVAEDPGKAEKVLALQPAGGGPFEDADSKLVLAGVKVRRQVKFRGGKAVLAVAHIVSVAPEGEAALHPLERDAERASLCKVSLHGSRDPEIFHIGSRGVKLLRDLSGHEVFPAVPGVLIVDIGWDIISLHLDMGGNADVRPAAAVKSRRFKALGRIRRARGIGKLPQTVQGITQRGRTRLSGKLLPAFLQFLLCGKHDMVRVRGEAVFLKDLRVLHDVHGK